MDAGFHVNRVNLSQQIADHIEELILSPEFNVNDRLPSEQELSSQFNVSRPIIREALKLLVERGLIVQKNGAGAFITKPGQKNIYKSLFRIVAMDNINYEEIHETRLILEISSARLAAKRITEKQLQQLAEIFQQELDMSIDMHKRVSLDAEFHNKIAEGSGNDLLMMFVQSLISITEGYMVKGGMIEGGKEDAIREHRLILDSLRQRDEGEAAVAMKKHLIQAITNVKKYCFEHQEITDPLKDFESLHNKDQKN
ncbi:MAG: FadR family transcriptional regulator [Spirochaetia bacterium]|jgi:DNA-binding FadR family transcriptional regulator|nr:FadR family transcriptional regulator [Spirochaetia bacterium]